MPIIPFPDYAPDISPFGSTSVIIQNVYPHKDGYAPVNSLSVYSMPLASTCHGLFYARNADASITIFAATVDRLWKMNNTDFSWVDVSKGTVAYPALPTGEQWQFIQFNNFVIAVQINVAPQVFDLTASLAFADLGGSPPQARYIAVVNRFAVLSGMGATTPYRIQWSALSNVTSWTPGVNSSDFQDLPDGGIVRGVASGETGLIMQDAAIRRMTYAPGAPYIFQIDRVTQDKGIFAPLSLVRGGDRVFFCGNDGFQMVMPGGYPQFIGKEKVDRTFFADVDTQRIDLIIGSFDPNATRILWSYKSLAGPSGVFDKLLVYDYILDKWTVIANVGTGEYIATLSKPGITLEGLDSISGSIDALPFSLDSVSSGTLAATSIVNSTHAVCFVAGPAVEATVETMEQALDAERRVRVRGVRVISDAPGCFASIGGRENLQTTVAYSAEALVNDKGFCPLNVSTRMARARLRVPAGTMWKFATGLDPIFVPEGKR